MSRALCFRCDWEGETRASSCPSCGAILYRPADAAATRAPGTPRARPPEDSHPAPGFVAPRGTAPWRSLLAMAIVALILAAAWTQIPRGTEAARRPAAPLSGSPVPQGSLVYAADISGSPDRQTLWSVDLATGTVFPGPRVPEVTELVDASAGGLGWIGLTARESGGTLRAYVLHGTSPRDEPIPLGSGDLAAWGPRGQEVVLAREGPLHSGCRRSVTIDLLRVETLQRERIFDEPNLCGDLLSLGRDDQLTYFTRVRNGRAGISYVGIGVAHSVLRGYVMLSVSPASDFIVTPMPELAPPGLGVDRSTVGGTALYWRGTGGPVPFGTNRDDLFVDHVLAWSADASEAVVSGRLDSQRGVYLIDAGPGLARRSPKLIVAWGRNMGATFSADGIAYLAIDGRLFAFDGLTLTGIRLPGGAPPPAGPIAWVP